MCLYFVRAGNLEFWLHNLDTWFDLMCLSNPTSWQKSFNVQAASIFDLVCVGNTSVKCPLVYIHASVAPVIGP